MQNIPTDLLRRILALPEGQPLRLVLNTNGHGAWQTEVTIFGGHCATGEGINLQEVVQQAELAHASPIPGIDSTRQSL